MAKEKDTTNTVQTEAIIKKANQAIKPTVAMSSTGLTVKSMDEAWRFAELLSRSQFVPAIYQKKPSDCLVAIDMAMRLKVAPLMFLQNSYIVKGKPGMESKLVITLINQSGLFNDPLDYEVEGKDPMKKDYKVRAFAVRKSTGKTLYGPWVSWPMVESEGWNKKEGSKWKTIPEIMFHYRAASWFANRHCPEVKMGMATVEELIDIPDEPRHVESIEVEPTQGREKFGFPQDSKQEQATEEEPPKTEKEPEKNAKSSEDIPAEPQWACTGCGSVLDDKHEKGEVNEEGKYQCPVCLVFAVVEQE